MLNALLRLGWVIAVLCAAFLSTSPAHATRFEAGTFVSHDTFSAGTRGPQRITFQQPFDVPPIVVAITNQQGGDAATIRITNVTTTGFDELGIEADNYDGQHVTMIVRYIAIEPGRHVFMDGTVIEAGFITTNAVQFGSGFSGGVASWATVNFSAPLGATPSVLHQVLTANSETNNPAEGPSRPFITSIAQSITGSSFQIALERSQANSGPFPSAETIGWIAFPAGGSGSFVDTAGNTVNWSAVNTPANIRGWSNGCFTNNTGLTSSIAVSVASKITRNNPDGGWLRVCDSSASTLSVRVDEDRDQDGERGLSAAESEAASIITFSRPFHANLQPDLVTVKTLTTADSAPAGGDTVGYRITVTNVGTLGATNVSLTDVLPAGLTATAANGVVSQGSFNPSTGLWTIGTVTGSTTATLDLEATVDIGQGENTITNVTTAAQGTETDIGPAGDDLEESITISPTVDLSLTKTNTPGVNGEVDQAEDFLTSGSSVSYVISVTNNGPDRVTGAVVTDTPTAGLDCAPATPVSITGNGLPAGNFTVGDLTTTGITLGTLQNSETATLSFDCTVL